MCDWETASVVQGVYHFVLGPLAQFSLPLTPERVQPCVCIVFKTTREECDFRLSFGFLGLTPGSEYLLFSPCLATGCTSFPWGSNASIFCWWICVWVLENIIKKTWPLTDLSVGPRHLEAPHRLPCPWDVASTCLSHSQSLLQGPSLEMMRWCWEYLHTICDWAQLGPLCKPENLGIHSCCCCLRQALHVSSLCLLKMPPTNLEEEQPASFFGFSLSWMFGS